ncbi:MAG: formate dehydrogenase subunit gamma [Caldimonas sp.]
MHAKILKAALVLAIAASAAGAGAQPGTAGVPRTTSPAEASQSPASAPAESRPQIQVIPGDEPPTIVLPPGSKATITTTVVPEPQPNDSNAQRAKSQPLNNAPLWRSVHESGRIPGTVNNLQLGEPGVLIQPITAYPGTLTTTAGEAWRQIRNWWIIPGGGALVLFVIGVLALYYWLKGPIGGAERPTGRLIERFTYVERFAHWSAAITFTILAVSGIVMSFGRFFLMPILGGQLFGWLTWLLKTLHNFVGPLFAVSIVLVFIGFVSSNWPTRSDWAWLRRGGGMLGGAHPPSHRFNAGEKIIFWGGVVLLGTIVSVSGFVLDKIVPGLELTRPGMQVAHIVHAIASMLIIAVFIGHAYMGTIGVRGSFNAMKTGYVDAGWAEEHHPLWHDDVAAGKIPARRSPPAPRREQPAA